MPMAAAEDRTWEARWDMEADRTRSMMMERQICPIKSLPKILVSISGTRTLVPPAGSSE